MKRSLIRVAAIAMLSLPVAAPAVDATAATTAPTVSKPSPMIWWWEHWGGCTTYTCCMNMGEDGQRKGWWDAYYCDWDEGAPSPGWYDLWVGHND